MTIAHAEQLKNALTDRYVVVADGIPELKRFAGLTGRVKTINMNCRALVEFNGPVDIGWYDIDPSYLTVVTEPVKKAPPEKPAKPAATASPAAPAAAKPVGKSPLEMARAQGGAKAPGAPAASPAKKLSPLEQARAQGAAQKAAVEIPAVAPTPPPPPPVVAAAPPTAPTPAVTPAAPAPTAREKPGTTADIIEVARRQGAFKG